jgi:hypothetical protein
MNTSKAVELFAQEIAEQKSEFMALSLISEIVGDVGLKVANEIIEAQDESPAKRLKRAMYILVTLENQISEYYKDEVDESDNVFGNPLAWIDDYVRKDG